MVWTYQAKAQTGPDTLFLNDGIDEYQCRDYIFLLEDHEGLSNMNEIDTAAFRAAASFDLLQPSAKYWGRMTLKNENATDQHWFFSPDYLSSPEHNGIVQVHLMYADSTLLKHSGRYLPFSQKDHIHAKDNFVQIHLKAGQSVNLIFSIEKINHSAPELNPYLFSKSRFQEIVAKRPYVREGILQGMLWMMILYSFVIFLGTKEKTYLIYSLFLLSSSIYFLYLSGVLIDTVLKEYPTINPYIRIIVSNLVPWAFFQFSRAFVNTKELIPNWDKVAKYILWFIASICAIELMICAIWFHEPVLNIMINGAFLVEGIFLLTIIIRFFFTPYRIARIFIFGSLCMVIAAFVGVGADIFLKVQDVLIIVEAAFVAQVLTFALGLAYKLRSAEREQLEAQKVLNEELKKADQLKNIFLANTSHELRTPLTGILGLSENMYERFEKLSADEAKRSLSMIVSSSYRLTQLVNDLLDFSKLKNKELSISSKAVDLKILVEIVIRMNQKLATAKQLELINHIADIPMVFGDENRIQQILFNLIGNAIKFTPEGKIEIDATQEGNLIKVSISDTGIGIPEEKREKIFEEFEQLDGTINRLYSGTGLGLSISKKLVELQGGQIWVESIENTGSTFYFTLQIASDQSGSIPLTTFKSPVLAQQPEGIPLSPLSNKQKLHQSSILIIDDEIINHEVLKGHLMDEGYELLSVMNGEDALSFLNKGNQPDLVLLDIMMPKLSGFEVCRILREKYLPSELPIIMVTAKNQVNDLVEGLDKGANDYLSKPFTRSELLARVRTQFHLHGIYEKSSRFVPKEFIRALGMESMLDLTLGDHISKEVSVLFADIRGYTSLAEGMQPDENFRFVNSFAGRMGPLIKQNKGFVHQYLGDCIMAIFTEHPSHSLQAAIDMQEGLKEYNQERISTGKVPLKIGIGMHTGQLIMGIIGDQNRTEAATISDTVNTASRMEGLTKFFGANILLSEDSLNQILLSPQKDQFEWRFLGKVQLKGRKNPIKVFESLNGLSDPQYSLKSNSKILFEQALKAYFKQDFVHAVGSFKKVLLDNPEDKAAAYYLSLSGKYVVEGVEKKWNGVISMTVK